jgi:hypothetical protein
MLVELSREEIQPLVYDECIFRKNKQYMLEKDQLLKVFQDKSGPLVGFQEHSIGIYKI